MQRTRAIFERPEFRHAQWGIEALDEATGQWLMSHNSDRLFVLGSTTKVLTMVTALEALGEVASAVRESMR